MHAWMIGFGIAVILIMTLGYLIAEEVIDPFGFIEDLIYDNRKRRERKRELAYQRKQEKEALEEKILIHKVALKKLELLEKGIKINEK